MLATVKLVLLRFSMLFCALAGFFMKMEFYIQFENARFFGIYSDYQNLATC